MGAAFIEFERLGGSFRFVAVESWTHCKHGQRNGRPHVTFTGEGNDECDPASSRGWASLRKDGSLRGHIYLQHGDDSGFEALPFREKDCPGAGGNPTKRRGWR